MTEESKSGTEERLKEVPRNLTAVTIDEGMHAASRAEQQHLRQGTKSLTRRDSDCVGDIKADNAGRCVLGAQALSRAAHESDTPHKSDTPTTVTRGSRDARNHKGLKHPTEVTANAGRHWDEKEHGTYTA